MKYGLLKFTGYRPNLGDYMQLEGIKQAYSKMGIDDSEIIEIERDLLSEYQGEYVILPMSCALNATLNGKIFPLSKKIIPIFIGFFTGDEAVAEEIAKYRDYGPFGCRDLVTLEIMRKQGVPAYMSGCFSIAFPKRSKEPVNDKVFLYDPPQEILPYIPENILKKSVRIASPHREMKVPGYSKENEFMAKGEVEKLIKIMREEATLVITKRLHMALPCIAMGIPVILAHKCDDGQVQECRFAGLDRIIKVYKVDEFADIDWNPVVPDIEWIKNKTIDLAIQRIKEAKTKWSNLCDLSEYYEATKPQIYYSGMRAAYLSEYEKTIYVKESFISGRNIFEYITKKKFENMNLVVYGAGDKGSWAIRRYHNIIKRVSRFLLVDGDSEKQGRNLYDVIDTIDWDFNAPPNYQINSPEVIREISKENLVIIVATNNYYSGPGAQIGKILIEKFKLLEGKEFFFLDKLNNSMELNLSETSKPFYFLHGF